MLRIANYKRLKPLKLILTFFQTPNLTENIEKSNRSTKYKLRKPIMPTTPFILPYHYSNICLSSTPSCFHPGYAEKQVKSILP